MAGEKTIATLVGKLRFDADYRPLQNFEKKLDAVDAKMKNFATQARKKIMLKIGVTPGWKKQLADIGAMEIKLKNILPSGVSINAAKKQIQEKLDVTKIRLKNLSIDAKNLHAQKLSLKTNIESTVAGITPKLNLKSSNVALREWKKTTESKVKLYLQADISKHKFYQNVKKSVEYVINKVGSIKLSTPKILVGIDRVHLRQEIADALEQIRREVRVKVQLGTTVGGRPHGGAISGRTMREHALTGGVAGMAAGWGRGFVPGLGGAFALSQLNRINQQLQAQQLAMNAVAGGPQAGKEQMAWMKNLANDIGLNYRAVTPGYTKMLASGKSAGLSTQDVQGVFKGVSEYGRVMGLDTEAMKGSITAIEQMMGKGQIMSEELKGQLAERMPGVVSAMAEAAGFGKGDTAVKKLFKAMSQGDVRTKGTIQKFAKVLHDRISGVLEEAKKTTSAEQARFQNAFSDSVKEFAKGGFDKGTAEFFKETTKSLEVALPFIRAAGAAFHVLIQPINAFLQVVASVASILPDFANSLGLTKGGLLGVASAVLLNLTPWGRVISLFGAASLALQDFMTFLKGGDSVFGRWFASLKPENQEKLSRFGEAIHKLGGSFGKLGAVIGRGWGGILDKIKGPLLQFLDKLGGAIIDAAIVSITSLAEGLNDLADALDRVSKGFSSGVDWGGSWDAFVAQFPNPGKMLSDWTYQHELKLQNQRELNRLAQVGPPMSAMQVQHMEINVTSHDPATAGQSVVNALKEHGVIDKQALNTTKSALVGGKK